jgi:hypothetical protein
MSYGSPWFVLAVLAICTIAWIVTTAIRAKHGYPIDEWGMAPEDDGIGDRRAAELMARENERLKGQVGRLEERIAVLERIATDPAERTAREIDRLR